MAPIPGDSSKHQFGTSMPQGGHPPHHSISFSARACSVSGTGSHPDAFQQLFQLFNRFRILRADWLVAASGIRSLQSAKTPRGSEVVSIPARTQNTISNPQG
jgi:hypothetical protein